MKQIIGFWFLALSLSCFLVNLEPDFDTKQKIGFVVSVMGFLTLLFIGSYLLVGGV